MFLHFLCLFSFFPFHFFISFFFVHFLSFSFIFFVFVGCSKSDFFLGLNFVTISLDSSYVKNQFLGPTRGLSISEEKVSSFLFSCISCIFFAGVSIRV